VNPDPCIDLAYVNCMFSQKDNMVFFSKKEDEQQHVYYAGGAQLVKLDLETLHSQFMQSSNKNIAFIAQN